MLSKAVEERLLQCVKAASAYAEEGGHPNAAIIKAAKELGIRKSEIPLIVRAYNVSRTNQQREFGTTLTEKIANFPVANTDQILAELYPEKVKSAADMLHGSAVSEEYAIPPIPIRRQLPIAELLPAHVKEAAEKLEIRDGDASQGREAQLWKRLSDRELARAGLKDANLGVAAAKEAAFTLMAELASALATLGARPYPAVKQATSTLYGRPGLKFLEAFDEYRPHIWKTTGQRANYNLDGTPKPEKTAEWENMSWDEDVLQKIAEGIRLCGVYWDALENHRIAAKEAAAADSVLRPRDVQPAKTIDLADFGVQPRRKAAASLEYIDLDELQKNAGFTIPATAALVSRNLAAGAQRLPPPDAKIEGLLTKLNDPIHEQQLASVGVQAMLAELMSTDPIIGTYKPNDVLSVYNQMSDLAPSVSRHPMSVAPILRKALQQGQLDTYDIDQIVQMDRKLTPDPKGM